jgi:hypothetical protein
MSSRTRGAILAASVLILTALFRSGLDMSFLNRPLPLSRTDREQQFWRWFAANSERLKGLSSRDDRGNALIAEIDRELARVHHGLTWEHDPKEGVLVISADGNRKLFPAVQKLVAAAPSIPGWRIVGFRQRSLLGDGFSLEYSNYKVRFSDPWFRLEPDGTKVGVTLFLPHPQEADRQAIGSAAFLLLDMALGEYDVETKLGFVEWKPLPEQPTAQGLRPFKELPSAVDRLYERLQSN